MYWANNILAGMDILYFLVEAHEIIVSCILTFTVYTHSNDVLSNNRQRYLTANPVSSTTVIRTAFRTWFSYN